MIALLDLVLDEMRMLAAFPADHFEFGKVFMVFLPKYGNTSLAIGAMGWHIAGRADFRSFRHIGHILSKRGSSEPG